MTATATAADPTGPLRLRGCRAPAQARPPPETSSRSTSSIVAGNVFTLFNAIIGVFFVLVLSLGLFADAVFGVIAIVNSYIGIRQELNAKRTLDELAVVVAPQAKVIRDGAEVELRAEEIVPGDLIAVEPGDQLVADGEVAASRGMTLDESMLTGEADGVRKSPATGRSPAPSASPARAATWSTRCGTRATPASSPARRKTFRHPPSPLQGEVNQVIVACTWILVPLAALLLITFQLRSVDLVEAAQTATAGLITLIPEGLVLLMSVTFAVAAVRLARRDTLIQQMSATESLASVDTDLRRQDRHPDRRRAAPARGRGRRRGRGGGGAHGARQLRGQRRRPQPHAGGDRRALSGPGGQGRRGSAVLLGVEVERPADRRQELRDGGARRPGQGWGADPPRRPQRRARARDRRPGAGSSPSASPRTRCRSRRPTGGRRR